MKPFRWNITKREQLGRLLDIDSEAAYSGYLEHIADCASLIVSRSAGKKIIFLGRSPENIYDYLSGVFQETSFEENIDLLNISNRFREIDDIEREIPIAYRALKSHFSELRISPEQIISNPNGVCFADLVDSGGTFEGLFEFLKKWAQEERQDLPSIVRKLSFIGITWRAKNSPNTWRWQQKANWIKKYPKITVKNVSVPGRLWDYLGNL